MAQVTTTARFQCPNCKEQVNATVLAPEVDWVVEPLSDSLSEDDIDIECEHCHGSFSAHVQNSPAGCFIELDEHPNVSVDADDAPFSGDGPDEEYWLNVAIPDSPYDVFTSTMHHLGSLIVEYGVGGRGAPLPASAPLINRMVFATTIAAMEAYLGDTLVTAVLSDQSSMRRLLTHDKELLKIRASLDDILGNPHLVSDKVREYLKELLYHNLAKVEILYKIATDVDILPETDLKERLHKAVLLRHDIVHRNGKGIDGLDRQFPTELVEKTIDDVWSFVRHIQASIR